MSEGSEMVSGIGDVQAAARWLATGGADRTKAAVPQIRARFNLSAVQAIAAIRESNALLSRPEGTA